MPAPLWQHLAPARRNNFSGLSIALLSPDTSNVILVLNRCDGLSSFTGKKEAIAEQLRLGQELRRKVDRVDTVAGSDEDTDTGAETSSSESEDEAAAAQRPRKGLSKKAAGKLQTAAAGILQEGGPLYFAGEGCDLLAESGNGTPKLSDFTQSDRGIDIQIIKGIELPDQVQGMPWLKEAGNLIFQSECQLEIIYRFWIKG